MFVSHAHKGHWPVNRNHVLAGNCAQCRILNNAYIRFRRLITGKTDLSLDLDGLLRYAGYIISIMEEHPDWNRYQLANEAAKQTIIALAKEKIAYEYPIYDDDRYSEFPPFQEVPS